MCRCKYTTAGDASPSGCLRWLDDGLGPGLAEGPATFMSFVHAVWACSDGACQHTTGVTAGPVNRRMRAASAIAKVGVAGVTMWTVRSWLLCTVDRSLNGGTMPSLSWLEPSC